MNAGVELVREVRLGNARVANLASGQGPNGPVQAAAFSYQQILMKELAYDLQTGARISEDDVEFCWDLEGGGGVCESETPTPCSAM